MTTEYFLGNEIEDFPLSLAATGWNTITTYYDPLFQRGAITFTNTSPVVADAGQSLASGWMTVRYTHTGVYGISTNSIIWGGASVVTNSSAGTSMLMRVCGDGVLAGTFRLQYWNGSSFTTAGSTFSMATAAQYKFDFQWLIAVAGYVRLYRDGILLAEFVGDTTVMGASLRYFHFADVVNISTVGVCEVMILDEDTRPQRLGTLVNTGAGTTNQWTGSASDVNEGAVDNTTIITSDAANQLVTFSCADPSGYAQTLQAQSVTLVARAGTGPFGPQNLKPAVRTNGSDYVGASVTGLTGGMARVLGASMQVNPVTGLKWTMAEILALETGWKSAA